MASSGPSSEPRVTNTSNPTRNGDAVKLADNSEVTKAIGLQTIGIAAVVAYKTYNSETYLGGQDIDADSLFGYPSDGSRMRITIDDNTFTQRRRRQLRTRAGGRTLPATRR